MKDKSTIENVVSYDLTGDLGDEIPEDIVLDEEGVTAGFEDKVLHERLWGIIISLE